MKNVIITGTNGMIGNLILELCLKSDEIGKITSITRKPIGIQHSKLTEIIHNDFLDLKPIEKDFEHQAICFYCLGVYTGQVPNEEFNKITIDYTKSFADMLRKQNENATFCFLSGAGADSTEKSNLLFAKAKGIAENHLIKLNFNQLYIFRPGYIYPVTKRVEPNFMYRVFRYLYKPLSFIYPNIGITSEKLASKMFELGLKGGNQTILENKDIRK